MNSIREIEKINEEELRRGIAGTPASWHAKYAKSAWVYVGNLDVELSEGDVICVMSQFGEIEDIHLVRQEDTGKSKGFAFVKYEDCRSCVLAVDNFVGAKLMGRSLRVDHVENYRLPKNVAERANQEGNVDHGAGHAYNDAELSNSYTINSGQDLFSGDPVGEKDNERDDSDSSRRRHRSRKSHKKEDRKRKKHKKESRSDRDREKHRHRRKRHRSSDDSDGKRRRTDSE